MRRAENVDLYGNEIESEIATFRENLGKFKTSVADIMSREDIPDEAKSHWKEWLAEQEGKGEVMEQFVHNETTVEKFKKGNELLADMLRVTGEDPALRINGFI